MQHFIEEGDHVRYDDGFDELQAEIVALHGETATVTFIKGNRRHPRKTEEEVSLAHLFPLNSEELMPEYHN